MPATDEKTPKEPKAKAAKEAAAPVALPTRCRVIEVTDDEGDTSAAIVTARKDQADGTVDLNVCLLHPVMGTGNAYIRDAAARQRPTSGEKGTWNWPPRS